MPFLPIFARRGVQLTGTPAADVLAGLSAPSVLALVTAGFDGRADAADPAFSIGVEFVASADVLADVGTDGVGGFIVFIGGEAGADLAAAYVVGMTGFPSAEARADSAAGQFSLSVACAGSSQADCSAGVSALAAAGGEARADFGVPPEATAEAAPAADARVDLAAALAATAEADPSADCRADAAFVVFVPAEACAAGCRADFSCPALVSAAYFAECRADLAAAPLAAAVSAAGIRADTFAELVAFARSAPSAEGRSDFAVTVSLRVAVAASASADLAATLTGEGLGVPAGDCRADLRAAAVFSAACAGECRSDTAVAAMAAAAPVCETRTDCFSPGTLAVSPVADAGADCSVFSRAFWEGPVGGECRLDSSVPHLFSGPAVVPLGAEYNPARRTTAEYMLILDFTALAPKGDLAAEYVNDAALAAERTAYGLVVEFVPKAETTAVFPQEEV